jgi:hypothetical protein
LTHNTNINASHVDFQIPLSGQHFKMVVRNSSWLVVKKPS